MSNTNRWDVQSMREYTDQAGVQKTAWTKVGSAFTNKNGSITVLLDCLPLDGKLQLQVPLSREEREAMFQNRQQGGQRQERQQNFGNQPAQGQGYSNPRNAGAQQRQGAAQRFGPRPASTPRQGNFDAPLPEPREYTPPGPPEHSLEHGESGWQVGSAWITDARELPKDHPDWIPF